MKSVKMAMLAGCLLAVAGCSQPHRAGMGMGGQGHGMVVMAGDVGCRDSRDGMKREMMGGQGMAGLRQQMFENTLEARKRVDSVLTPQQREQLGRRAGGQ